MALKLASSPIINGLPLIRKIEDPVLAKALGELKIDKDIIKDVDAYNNKPIKSVYVSQITDILRANSLQNIDRVLISDETTFKALLAKARDAVRRVEDVQLMALAVKKELPEMVRKVTAFYVETILKNNGKKFTDDDVSAITARLVDEKYQVGGYGSDARVISVYDLLRQRGNLPAFVETYIGKMEIDPTAFTPLVKEHMIRYLMDLNFSLQGVTDERINEGHYDEYFALAYNHALKTVKGGDDPIDAFRNKGNVEEWDFTVEEFDTVEEQGVIPENVLAAGALDYIYELGDNLGIFRLTDFLILNWVSGNIDINKGPIVNKMYRHLKLKDERAAAEERSMLYKRVLNKGEGKILDNMVLNDDFPTLWTKLMEEVVKYIEKAEGRAFEIEVISKQPVYQAIRDLQYNLTSHMTGMAPIMTREMYSHLTDCFDILKDKQIIDQLATGSRKNMWVVIENLAKQDMKFTPNVSAFRTVAVKSNQIFRFIAEFNGMAVGEDKFHEFKEAVEAYIIAQSQLDNVRKLRSGDEDEDGEELEDDDDMNDFDA